MDAHGHDAPRMDSPPHHGVMMTPPFDASAMMQAMFNPMPAAKPMDMAGGSMFNIDGGGIGMQQHGDGGVHPAPEPGKKKRGRPRKYSADGSSNNVGLALRPAANAGRYSGPPPASEPSAKRRGRPPGSGKKKQMDALGSAGTSFTPHLLVVNPNEDVASKILAFSQQGPRTTCVISANGVLSSVTIRQPAISRGIVTLEGPLEIISLSGSFVLAEDGNSRSRTGGLSVALSAVDGRIVGGCVAGMLVAATPVQVIMGSFVSDKKKPKLEAPKDEPSFGTALGNSSAVSPPSEGTSSDPSDDPGSLGGHNGDASCINSGQHFSPGYGNVSWGLGGNQGRYDDPNLRMMAD